MADPVFDPVLKTQHTIEDADYEVHHNVDSEGNKLGTGAVFLQDKLYYPNGNIETKLKPTGGSYSLFMSNLDKQHKKEQAIKDEAEALEALQAKRG